MFDIGFSELLLIFVVGLVVLGPKRLPIAIRTVMGWVATVRGLAANVQKELTQELKLQELQESIKKAEELQLSKLSPELSKTVADLKETARKMQSDLDAAQQDFKKLTAEEVAAMQDRIELENQKLESLAGVHESEQLHIVTPTDSTESTQTENHEVVDAQTGAQATPSEREKQTAHTELSPAEIAEQAEMDESHLSVYFPPDDDLAVSTASQPKQDKQ